MIDEKITQLAKDFLKENSIDELRNYLAENGYNFEDEGTWFEILKPIVREMGVPEDQIEGMIRESFED